jgi:hypothetical protein
LNKAELGIENDSIVIIHRDRSKQGSIWQRAEAWNMPATTNSVESMNGQMNEKTPKRNSFWRSMFSIVGMMFQKTQLFRQHTLQNFNDALKPARKRTRRGPIDIMTAECQYFTSSAEKCEYSDTRLQSKMFRVQIPCSHQFALRYRDGIASKPDLSEEVNRPLKKGIDHLQFAKLFMRRNAPVPDEQHVRG